MLESKSLWWQNMAWPEVVAHAKKCDIALLPMGAIEQHGPHLPTGHDTLQMFKIGEMISEKTGAILLPSPWYGAHPYHHWYFPGTIPLQFDTARALVKDIIRGASVAGYNKFIIFFGHGQAQVMSYATHELGLEGYFVISTMIWTLAKDVHPQIFQTPFWHADESETSVALYTNPEYVDMTKAAKEMPTRLIDSKWVESPSETKTAYASRFDELTYNIPEYKDLKLGIIGDATLATREKGEKYVTTIVDRMTELIEEIKTRYPVGVKPPIK